MKSIVMKNNVCPLCQPKEQKKQTTHTYLADLTVYSPYRVSIWHDPSTCDTAEHTRGIWGRSRGRIAVVVSCRGPIWCCDELKQHRVTQTSVLVETQHLYNRIWRVSRAEPCSLSLNFLYFILFFWSTCLFKCFSCRLSETKSGKKRYCIVMRVIPFGSFFFFLFIWIHFPLTADSGYVEMCRRVLKTLRRMINIKVFYKKVYNHLDIYTNTQIYIYIYIYIYVYTFL